jgi:hypothetical protein
VEEVVCLDLCGSFGAKSRFCIAIEQPGKEVTGSRRHNVRAREVERFTENLAIHLVCVFIVERRQTRQHLVEQNAERPPIYRLGVAAAREKFRRKVLWSAAECFNLSIMPQYDVLLVLPGCPIFILHV